MIVITVVFDYSKDTLDSEVKDAAILIKSVEKTIKDHNLEPEFKVELGVN
jgi:hypothetical protein